MLESRSIRELCRNGEPHNTGKSDTAKSKSLEHWSNDTSISIRPSLERLQNEGIFMSVESRYQTETIESDIHPIAPEQRLLSHVDTINNSRLPDGRIDTAFLEEHLINLIADVKEGGIPNAVNTITQQYLETGKTKEDGSREKALMYLGKTAVEHAQSGYAFHRHPEARKRVDVEVDEASFEQDPQTIKVLISPRMTSSEVELKIAEEETLAHDDALRISEVSYDGDGNIVSGVMQALLVRDIPLEAWVAMLKDPDNIFGRSIIVSDETRSLAVMQVHDQLVLPKGALPEGVISLVAAVIPYVPSEQIKASVMRQLERFREDQVDIDDKAVNIAKRWQEFEMELAGSLKNGIATLPVEAFINSLQSQWGDDDLEVINGHRLNGSQRYFMSRELAIVVERAKKGFLRTRAAIVTDNEDIVDQIDIHSSIEAKRIKDEEEFIQIVQSIGYTGDIRMLEMQTDRALAGMNIEGGRGCSGNSSTKFKTEGDNPLSNTNKKSGQLSENNVGEIHNGKCIVEKCPTRPGEVKLGGCGVCIGRCQKIYDKGGDPSILSTGELLVKMLSGKRANQDASRK
jgi:hypothetical protein